MTPRLKRERADHFLQIIIGGIFLVVQNEQVPARERKDFIRMSSNPSER